MCPTGNEDSPGGGFLYRPDGECVYETADWSEGVAFVTASLLTNRDSATTLTPGAR